MAKTSGAARRSDPASIALDPLEYWLDQERRPLPDLQPPGPDGDDAADPAMSGETMPAGWWLVPGLLAALPVWAVIGWWIFG